MSRRRKRTVKTFVDNTAKLRPKASVLAPRPCTCSAQERRRGQQPVHHDQVHSWRRGHRPGHHDQALATHNEWRRGKRPGRNDEESATHNERRREQWPKHHDHPPLVVQRLLKLIQSPTPGHVPRFVCVCGPSLLAVFIKISWQDFWRTTRSTPLSGLYFF
jgi:hypothetical protein